MLVLSQNCSNETNTTDLQITIEAEQTSESVLSRIPVESAVFISEREMSVERTCCVVTVSESSCRPRLRNPLSCSGVILSEQSGIVVCSGLLFSPFLIDKDCISPNLTALHANNFSNNMQVSIYHADMTADECTGKLSIKNGHQRPPQNAELLMMVNCMEFQKTFQSIFTEAEKWNFYSGDEDAEILFDSNFLSWFAVLRMPGLATGTPSGTLLWVKSTSLIKGHSVLACGSPFGSFCPDLFMSTLSKGIVSNLAGEENALILTDARCLPGTEGGGLFVINGDVQHLVGLITSPLCWKSNEWIGLSLVCSFHLILRNILQAVTSHQSLREISAFMDIPQVSSNANQKPATEKYPMVAVVESGQLWGSGILLNPNIVLTCRHVVNGKTLLQVRVNARERFLTVTGRVLYSSKTSSPYDVAVVELQEPYSDVVVPQLATSYHLGEDVVVLGYGALGKTCGPSVTSGILSRVITQKNKPVMLQTTCAVQCGASGGAVIRASTGELMGIMSSNTRDFAAKTTYPHLNFSIPLSVLEPLLGRFDQTGDASVFQVLDSVEDEVRRVWRLQIPQSKL
ncbi:peroxisomal leader peptide-processing protease [Pygocentrus nattereri]|uniref:Peroxisomal leader peptide-processing protease n=1 Tax=Pygocentrus nattereri TaxID=42514 RepID=A0A3B4DKK5_PYGNA|nr:peroxisomal leader peptide-processing protease [Pygocentrus nattereri]